MDHHDRSDHAPQAQWGRWVLIGFLAVAAFFLWSEHRAHLLGALPYLLVLACPLMHLFHHGHGGHRHHGSRAQARDDEHSHARKPEGEES